MLNLKQVTCAIASLLISAHTLLALGTVEFNSASHNQNENQDTLTLTVSRSGDTSGSASVSYNSSAISATALDDYSPVSGTLNWDAGDGTDRSIDVPILDDQLLENEETFTVALSNPVGVSIGTTDTATITIVDVEEGILNFTSNGYTVSENAGSTTITVVRINGTDGDVSVDYTTGDGTATAGSDYTATSGTLSWTDGDFASKTFTITITEDSTLEENETINIQLSNVTNATLGNFDSATLTIAEYALGEFQFSSSTYFAFEDAGTVPITVQRINGSNDPVSVDYATSAITADGDDFTSTSGTLEFADGETSQTFTITLADNAIGEPDETITLSLSSPAGGATLAEQSTATFTILNDDLDYSPIMDIITPSLEDITIGNAMDLSDALPNGGDGTVLEAINALNTLQQGGLVIEQDASSGLLRMNIGDISYHFYPTQVLVAQPSDDVGMFISANNEVRFFTETRLLIVASPTMADFEALKDALNLFNLQTYNIEENGNINIPAATGTPPLIINDNGEVVIADEYFDRFNARPDFISNTAEQGIVEGINTRPHPHMNTETVVVMGFNEEGSLRQQYLYPAPVDEETVRELLNEISGISDVYISGTGIITATFNGQTHRLLTDYDVSKDNPPGSGQAELSIIADQNNDGVADIKVSYSDGETQIFFYYPP